MSATAAMASEAKSKQGSRKGKKAWRKNVDVTDINEGLENLRTEIEAGGVIAEKPNEALFSVDTVGSTAIKHKSRREHKPLRCDEILAQRSAVPALESRKRPNSIIGDGIIKESAKKRRLIGFKELRRLRRIAYGEGGVEGQDIVMKGADEGAKAVYDPWGDGELDREQLEKEKEEAEKYSFLEKPKPKVLPVTLKEKPVSLAASKGAIPAVRLPDPGISYNPEFEKWDDLLTREGDKEVEAEKKRLAAAAQEAYMRQKRLEAEQEPSSAESESEDEEEDDGDQDQAAQFVKKRPERKTQAQRNKIKRRKEAEREVKRLEHIKKQKAQLLAIKKLARAVEEKERMKLQQLVTGSAADPDADVETLRKKRFGKRHIPQAPLELKLPEELTDSLRLLKPEGNLVRDRYRSFLERGILETRIAVSSRRKARTYTSEKWSYKDWKL